jgi:hypothetical protein
VAKRRRSRPSAVPSRAIGRNRLPDEGARRPAASVFSPAVPAVVAVLGIGLVAVGLAIARSPSPSPSPSPSAPASAELSQSPSAAVATITPTTAQSGEFRAIDGVLCDELEQTAFHIHAHLAIRVRGESQTVPAGIGIHETCLYWVHTHRDSGIIHVEAPADAQVTVGTFFDIWGQPLTAGQVAGWTAGSGESVYAFVDGQRFTGDPRTVRLEDLENIELQVGPAPLDPLPFTFPADF